MEHQKSMDEKKLLFGADKARDKVIVVEGPLGAIRVGVGAVATMGLAVTQAQLSRLTEYQSRVICFDSEPAAQRRANRLAEQLASFPGHTSVVELDADDPGEIAQAEKESLRKFAFGSAAEWA
jgi:DNA primase